jgi:LDH2 family malate/lactate/ureidoglycolate dehydrogenase
MLLQGHKKENWEVKIKVEVVVTKKQNLMDFCSKALEKVGVNVTDAKIAAEVLTTNEMRGIKSHGVIRLEGYIKQLILGTMNNRATLDTVREGQAWVLVDGNFGLGVVTAHKAMKIAIKKAKQNGIGMVCVKNSLHFSAAGYYSWMCANENMIGIAMSNADITMTIPGAVGRVIGNNPFSYAAPAGKDMSICLDMAMSKVAGGKIVIATKENRDIPNDWMVDSEGRPTTDPGDYDKGGALLPFGGYKGYGLAIMVECLAAALSGASMTKEATAYRFNSESNGSVGHFFIAINIDHIIPIQDFKNRVSDFIKELKNSPMVEGVKDIFFPGEIEFLNEKDSAKNGIKLGQATINTLKTVADDLKLNLNL